MSGHSALRWTAKVLSKSLSVPLPERTWLLHVLDVTSVNLSLVLYLWLHPNYSLSWQLVQRRFMWFVTLTFIWLLTAHAFEAYAPRITGHWRASVFAVTKASTFTGVIYLMTPFVTPMLPVRRSLLLAFLLAIVALPSIERAVYTRIFSQPLFLRRTLIVGAGRAGQTIADVMLVYGRGSYELIGFVDDAPEKQAQRVSVNNTRVPILGTRHQLRTAIQQYGIDTIVLAITHDVDAYLLQILLDCLEMGVEIIPMPLLYERLTGRVPVQHVGENWYIAMPIHHPLTQPINQVIKRLSDIVFAVMGLIILFILFPLIALAIYLDSPGPILYTQTRVGKGGRIFKMYKFRSMIPDAEREGAIWAQENDPRVTYVGRILRRTHLDELPQVINVLRGEMSVVGPRPERPEFAEELAREIPFYRVRHAVYPGMAGWAMVKYGYVASKKDALKRLEYDLYYIKHWSLWFDLVILLKATLDVVTLRGRA